MATSKLPKPPRFTHLHQPRDKKNSRRNLLFSYCPETRKTLVKRFACLLILLAFSDVRAADPVSFRSDIAPILQDNCVSCHGAKKAEGGYRVDTFAELSKAGDSGELPLVTAKGQTSELLRRMTTSDESERMPAESEPLTESQTKLIEAWIASGASFDGADPAELLPFVIPAPRHVAPPESYSVPVPITALAFASDGGQVLVGGYHEVTVWDATEGKLIRRISNIGQRVYALALSHDAATLAVACGTPGRSGEVRLVDLATGDVKGVIARSTDVALDVAFRPGSDQLAVASADQMIRIVDAKTLKLIRKLPSHADWVTAVAWSDDGSKLASASRDKSAKVFDAESGQLLASYQGHGAAVRGVTFLPDGKQVVSTGSDNKLHRWNVDRAKKVAEVGLGGEGYRLVRGDGFVLVPCADRRLLKIDLSSNKVTGEFKGHEDWVLSAAFDAAQSRIASGAFDGQVRLWNSDGGELINSWLAKP
jgi:DNA-binding beta-propeller fold protein YncE